MFRLSGTGSTGATIRLYLEKYEPDVNKQVCMGNAEISVGRGVSWELLGSDGLN